MRATIGPFWGATTRRPLASLVVAIVTMAACTSPAPAPAPTPPPTSLAAVAPASVATGQPASPVVHLETAGELEQLRGQGQPILLAVLDRSNDSSLSELNT